MFFRDFGLLHYLLGIPNETELFSHPKIGASWEGYAMEETTKVLTPDEACCYWDTLADAEPELFLIKDGHRMGFDFKRFDVPGLTPSMRSALEALDLEKIFVVYPGTKSYPLTHGKITTVLSQTWL